MKEKNFNVIIFKHYGQTEDYEKIKYHINKVRFLMLREHKAFERLSAKEQFNQCATIGRLIVDTLARERGETDKKDYAIQDGFEEKLILK